MIGQQKPKGGQRRAPPPLNETRLKEIELAYVGRFATSRGKLRAYLQRKIRERGCDDSREPDLEGLADDRLGRVSPAVDGWSNAFDREAPLGDRVADRLRSAGLRIPDHGGLTPPWIGPERPERAGQDPFRS